MIPNKYFKYNLGFEFTNEKYRNVGPEKFQLRHDYFNENLTIDRRYYTTNDYFQYGDCESVNSPSIDGSGFTYAGQTNVLWERSSKYSRTKKFSWSIRGLWFSANNATVYLHSNDVGINLSDTNFEAGKTYIIELYMYLLIAPSSSAYVTIDGSALESSVTIYATKTNEWEYQKGYIKIKDSAIATDKIRMFVYNSLYNGSPFYLDDITVHEVEILEKDVDFVSEEPNPDIFNISNW